jgi:hypothetical protein
MKQRSSASADWHLQLPCHSPEARTCADLPAVALPQGTEVVQRARTLLQHGDKASEIAPIRTNSGLAFLARLGYHVAMRNDTIDRLARRLADAVPEGLRSVRDDLEQNFRAVLDSGLSRLDLVTREEFEVQQGVLARTRQKLEALERRVSNLEGKPVGGDASAANDESSDRKTE